jgi:long-chain acyl-CoA synthetase
MRGTPDAATNAVYRLMGPLRNRITAKIRRQVVGPQFEFFISGGAKLPLDTAAFLWAIGLPVHEGYGSTESNCPVATNTPFEHRLGSVGRLFAGVEMRIDPANRELWLRGPNIVRRYWHTANDRQSTWTDDGWYRTRDVARQDADGFLYIEDRVDNILVLWNGENVSASAIEQRFSAVPYVDTAIVVGHQRPGLIALVTLNEEMIGTWAERNGQRLASNPLEDAVVDRLLREQIELHVNSRAGHPCERIRQVTVIEPLATEQQTLTATEKVRRTEIERRYRELIERVYQNQSDWLPAGEFHSQATELTATGPAPVV